MNNKELKTLWKVARIFWLSSTIFWIFETVIFLIIEGWHWKATHPVEVYCDGLVYDMWEFALNLTVFICIWRLVKLK